MTQKMFVDVDYIGEGPYLFHVALHFDESPDPVTYAVAADDLAKAFAFAIESWFGEVSESINCTGYHIGTFISEGKP